MPIAAPRPETWLRTVPGGLYCEPGGFFIDPTQPVDRAVITHGHGDHARPGNAHVLATPETIAIMRARYGESAGGSLQASGYGETVTLNGVAVTLVPAGHVLGSAQVVLEYRGSRVVVSGDYKRRRDPDLRAVRAAELRRLHHRGDLRPAGVPPSAGQPRDRPAAALAASVPRALPPRRRLCARQVPARHRPAARGRV